MELKPMILEQSGASASVLPGRNVFRFSLDPERLLSFQKHTVLRVTLEAGNLWLTRLLVHKTVRILSDDWLLELLRCLKW